MEVFLDMVCFLDIEHFLLSEASIYSVSQVKIINKRLHNIVIHFTAYFILCSDLTLIVACVSSISEIHTSNTVALLMVAVASSGMIFTQEFYKLPSE